MNETYALHTIPQLHLRRFGFGPKNQGIWVYDKHKDLIFPGTVRSSSVRPDYYRVARASGEAECGLERELFQKAETIAAPHLAKLLSLQQGERPFDPMARFHLAHYLAIQRARVPAMIKRAEEAAVFQGKTLEDLRLEWLTLFRSGELEIRPPKGFALVHVLDLALKTQPQAFFDMAWEIREATAPPWLVLGEEPVVAVMPPGTPADEEQGFRTPGIEIVIPLSPERLLVMHDGRTADVVVVNAPLRSAGSDDWVRGANLASWRSASLHVWDREKADLEPHRKEAMVGTRLPHRCCRAEPRTHVLGHARATSCNGLVRSGRSKPPRARQARRHV